MFTRLKNQLGFSLIEVMLATGLTGGLVLGASTVMSTTVTSQKKTEVQSIIDREFALGAQIASNTEIVKRVVGIGAADDCLMRDRNTSVGRNCLALHPPTWTLFPMNPDTTNPNPALRMPVFNRSFSPKGSDCEADAQNRCSAKREMSYRWICTADECSGIETRVVVGPIIDSATDARLNGKKLQDTDQAGFFRPREAIVKLDRRQLLTRAELSFVCSSLNQSMTRLDYEQARDLCTSQPVTDCVALPNQTYNPFAPASTNCAPPLYSSCPDGYEFTGIYNGSVQCRPPAAGRTNGPVNDYDGGTAAYTPNPPPPSAENASTSYQTYTVTVTSTETQTVAGPPPTPTCDMNTHTLYEYYSMTHGYYYAAVANAPHATSLGYSMTGENFLVFTASCADRTPLIDCNAYDGGGHYLANGPCGHLGSPIPQPDLGYVHNFSIPQTTHFLTRYFISAGTRFFRKSTTGGPPPGMTFEGGQGYLP